MARRSSFQEGANNLFPLRVVRRPRWSHSGVPIPISCIRFVPLLTVQVRVHSCAIRRLDLLGNRVRLLPVAFRVPPQGREQWRYARWRQVAGQTAVKFLENHRGYFRPLLIASELVVIAV